LPNVDNRSDMKTPPMPAEETVANDGYPPSAARRRWLASFVASGAGTLVHPAETFFSSSQLAFPPAVFDAANGRALVGVIGNRASVFHVRWHGDREPALSRRSQARPLTKQSNFADAIELLDLPDAGVVRYAVFNGDVQVSAIQQFRAGAHIGSRRDFTIAFSGDMEERYRPFKIFDAVAALKPDCFVHLGDTVYADIPKREFEPTLEHYRRKHAAIRADRSLQALMTTTPFVAMWDDHEIENGAHREHPAIAAAERVFREFWPAMSASGSHRSNARNDGDAGGLYRKLTFGTDVVLFVLDTRRFRSPQSEPDGASKTMLGREQLAWFRREYEASTARFRLIASAVPFHGSSQDAWGNYANERDALLAIFRSAFDRSGAKTIVLSADYHFAREWPRNERRGVYEFMAGPLAAFLTFERDNGARARHTRGEHFVYGDSANFGMLRYDASMRMLRVSYYGESGKRLYERAL
jgi:phosphodiesterase/alkaline phosphatase D-like protein